MRPKGLIELIQVIWTGDGWAFRSNKDIKITMKALRYNWGIKKFNKVKKLINENL